MMLDPVYNAKAFTGMLDRIKRKKLQGCFVYINTGGSPGIFTDYFRKKTEKSLKP
jgi:1-aminocyclopropane-1-carboxylate deaminase/D-cysteine desulfhydrase-like pyridoxal-dependent ACC family enzyme